MGGMNFRDRTYGFVSGLSGVSGIFASESLSLNIPMRLALSGSKDSTAATDAFSVPGVLATDYVYCQVYVKGASNRYILTAAPTANVITVVWNGDPSTDHKIKYFVFRAV